MRLAVTGVQGQVATSLIEQAKLRGHEIVALARPSFDLGRPDTIAPALAAAGAKAVISCAAYTAVDMAEGEPEKAYAINAIGPGELANAAADLGIPLVHLSTDYVFDGSKPSAYRESDSTGPLGVYGASKLAGENAVLAAHRANSAIVRTSWVYSPFGSNFVKTMLRLANDRDEVDVVADQIGNPTSALDIATGIFTVAENLAADPATELRGVFHMSADGETSWADFAEAIFAISARLGKLSARVRRITTSEYPTPARRPLNSRLNCEKLAAIHRIRLPNWRGATETVVARLLG